MAGKYKANHTEFEAYVAPSHGGNGTNGRADGYDPRRIADPRQALVTPGLVPINPASYRDERDARMQGAAAPLTEFPDENLGAVRSNIRSYTRGIHMGERLNPSMYLWPEEFGPDTGIKMEKKGLQWTAADEAVPSGIAPGPNSIPGEGINEIDPSRQPFLTGLLPTWR